VTFVCRIEPPASPALPLTGALVISTTRLPPTAAALFLRSLRAPVSRFSFDMNGPVNKFALVSCDVAEKFAFGVRFCARNLLAHELHSISDEERRTRLKLVIAGLSSCVPELASP
jgi:hypothetical protein